jgi:hypothetical protein
VLLLKVFDIYPRFFRHFTQQFLDERFPARANVMIDAVDERSVEVEEYGGQIGAF